jgi:transposase
LFGALESSETATPPTEDNRLQVDSTRLLPSSVAILAQANVDSSAPALWHPLWPCRAAGAAISRRAVPLRSCLILSLGIMPVVTQRVHPAGLSLAQQQKVYMFRKTKIKNQKGKMKPLSWEKIAKKVINLKGKSPSWKWCSDVFKRLNTRTGHVAYKYANCGRKSTLTPALRQWLISRLLALRTACVCTSTTLQRELAQTKKVKIDRSAIRKVLAAEGYKWLPRIKKPKYSDEVKADRDAHSPGVCWP